MTTPLRRSLPAMLVENPAPSQHQARTEVDRFLTHLRDEYADQPPPVPHAALAATLAGRIPPDRMQQQIPDPLSNPRVPSRRRRAGRVRVAAIAFAGATVTMGGLAAAGTLPAPLQRAAADLAGQVGIQLSHPTSSQPAPHHHPVPASATPNHSTHSVTTTTSPVSGQSPGPVESSPPVPRLTPTTPPSSPLAGC